jgi:hypothetical protein
MTTTTLTRRIALLEYRAAGKIPLSEVAMQLRITYEHAKRLVFTHELDGEQVNGRWWFVTQESVDRLRAARGLEAKT